MKHADPRVIVSMVLLALAVLTGVTLLLMLMGGAP